jgi:hypothetical protein
MRREAELIENSSESLLTLRKICELLELLAEDKIAQRDAKQRAALLEIVGKSAVMQRAVLLMDGTRTQKDIHTNTSVHKGNLSTMIGRLNDAKLITGDAKKPKLSISIPKDFFETNAKSK